MQLENTASSIGLMAYHQDDPGALLYGRFYSLVITRLASLKIEPTYLSAVGNGYPEKYTKFGGGVHHRLIDSSFEGISGISIAANPLGSDAPGYDSFFEGGISTVESGFPNSVCKEVYLYFVLNEHFLPFGGEVFEITIKQLIDLHPWDFGMGFCDAVEKRPVFHIGCLGHDKLTAEERVAFQAWYSTRPENRVMKLRSVYPYNIVNERQLSQEVETGISLKMFIEKQHVGTLTPLNHNQLFLWKVIDDGQRLTMTKHLKERGIVVT